ncbi:Elongation factor 1-delta [Lemmus lemmus]
MVPACIVVHASRAKQRVLRVVSPAGPLVVCAAAFSGSCAIALPFLCSPELAVPGFGCCVFGWREAKTKMRSGKASCALETVWEDKHKYEDAERRFHEHEATRAAASVQQLLAKMPAVNGPSQEDTEDPDEAEAPNTDSRSDPRKSQECKKPVQKKRKRSPKSWLGQSDLALVGLSADHVWLDKPLFDQAESSYRQRLADVAAQTAQPPALAPRAPCTHGSHVACHHVIWGIWVNKSCFDQAERAFVEWSQALLLAVEGSRRQGTPDTGQQAASPDLVLACQPCPPANGQPPLGSLQALVQEVWLEKPRYDAAERGFYEALFDGHPPGKVRLQERASQAEGARRGRRDRRSRNTVGNKRAGSKRADGEAPSSLPYWYFLHKDAEAPWLSKPTYDSAECRHHAAEALRIAWRLEAASLAHRPTPRSGPSMSSLRPNRKMATNFLVHEKIWFDKFKYDDAERKFYEQMNGPVAAGSRQENGASVILRDIARARENIQKSLAGLKVMLPKSPEALGQATPGTSSGPGASSGPAGDHSELIVRIASLEVENQNLRGVVQDLQQAISKLEARLSTLEKSSPTHRATAPQTQHVSPMRQVEPPTKKAATPAEDDEDNDIDLFGSDEEEEDKEAARLREERLRQYAEKKAKKPSLVAKSSILLDVKPWDDETDMAQLEACVRSVQLDGLVWGGSKLVPVGYGIRKLQIQCVVEDDKVGTDLLEEEITKFEEHVQSVDIAAFNKI